MENKSIFEDYLKKNVAKIIEISQNRLTLIKYARNINKNTTTKHNRFIQPPLNHSKMKCMPSN